MGDMGAAYAGGRARLSELVLDLDDQKQRSPVPTCPGWTVHDVIAHLTGVCADVLTGKLNGVTTDPWTAAQVDARRDRTTAEVVGEWSEVAPRVEAMAVHFPGRVAEQWVFDLTTHEHDVRTAVGRPGARDSEGVEVALDFVVTAGFQGSLVGRGLPPLRVRTDGRDWVVGGDGPAAGDLEAPPFELFRALSGRRSAAQIRALCWSCDPEPYVPAFEYGPFTLSRNDIDE